MAVVPSKPANQLSYREHKPELVASQSLGYGAEGWCQNILKSGSFLGGIQMFFLCPVVLWEECKAPAVKRKPRQNFSGWVTNPSLRLCEQKFMGLLVNLRWAFHELMLNTRHFRAFKQSSEVKLWVRRQQTKGQVQTREDDTPHGRAELWDSFLQDVYRGSAGSWTH